MTDQSAARPEVLVVIDLETTGTNRDTVGIVQLGAVGLYAMPPEILISTYCQPSVPIEEEATAIHKITSETVQYAPSESWALQQLGGVLHELSQHFKVVLGGYNVLRFDFPIIMRLDPTALANGFQDGAVAPVVDGFVLARRAFPLAEHRLSDTYTNITGKKPIDAHHAVADCLMTAELLYTYGQSTNNSYSELAAWLREPVAYQVMPFGKYKGRDMKDVPISWFTWMLENAKDMDVDLGYTVKKRLGLA